MKSSFVNLVEDLLCPPEDLEAGGYDVKTTCQLFEMQAERVPHHIALLYQDTALSYQSLNEKTNQLARIIRKQYQLATQKELTPNTLIPISIKRSADFVIGILAILKAGGAYVPINPEYPDPRIKHILAETGSNLIVTEPNLFDKFKQFNSDFLTLSLEDNQFESEETHNLNVPLTANDLAYVIYTSGSSGTPKGVMATHATLISQTVCASYFYADESDTVAFFSDVSFDSTTTEIWGALLSGARLFVPDNFFELLSDPNLFKATVRDRQLSVVLLTRALFDLLYSLDETVFEAINFMMVGGEALTKHIMLKLAHSPHKPNLLINAYGPTENSTFCTTYKIEEDFSRYSSVPIGKPYSNRVGFVLDKQLQLMPIGAVGELFVSGTSLSRGYLNHPELTSEKFIPNPYFDESGKNYARIYKTNDLVKWLPEGNLEYIGRNDFMVKLRGYRIELGEIETRMAELPDVSHSVVLMESNESLSYLIGYYVAPMPIAEAIFKEQLAKTLPEYMIPSVFVHLSTLPVTTNGKLDRKALPKARYEEKPSGQLPIQPSQSVEQIIADIWASILKVNQVNREQSFFNLGGNSLAAMMVRKELEKAFSIKVNMVDLFQYPTLASLTQRVNELQQEAGIEVCESNGTKLSLCRSSASPDIDHLPKEMSGEAPDLQSIMQSSESEIKLTRKDYSASIDEPIAVVGMSCRLPGVNNPEEFWQLISQGKTNLRDFSLEELKTHQISEANRQSSDYVKRGAVFDDPFLFDAGFFGYSVKDAEFMDPQHRQFLECAWEALEHSGTVPEYYSGEIGVFATQGRTTYFMDHLYPLVANDPKLFQAILGNDKDFLSTRVSYKLNLTGPSITTQTACSSSLVTIQMACDSLKSRSCDMALAGGVSLFYNYGYTHQEELIESPDGYCRAFDAQAQGTVITSGVGIVVLKRLSEALADKDTVYAVIKGGAVNNDGATKMAFTAPSITGQSKVIQKALANAQVTPDTISYIESHGTGTMLGDPIEWSALHQVYQQYTEKQEYCTIGAVKTNIGHTDAAAGVFGVIKTCLSLQQHWIPATLNFKLLNPEIAQFNKLFKVSNQSAYWQTDDKPRRAAVSSFGLGGTNAHMIFEEYEADLNEPASANKWYLIPYSAKNVISLKTMANKYQQFLHTLESSQLAHVAFTAQQGRAQFNERGFFIVGPGQEQVLSPYKPDHQMSDALWYFNANIEILCTMLNRPARYNDFMGLIWCQLLGTLWSNDILIDWQAVNPYPNWVRKVSIPTYCYNQTHYEIAKPKSLVDGVEIVTPERTPPQDDKLDQSIEAQLKEMWAEVLGVKSEELNVSSDFFELGGDSLAYIDLFNLIKKRLCSDVVLDEIIELIDLGSMCEFISSKVVESETV